MVKKRELPRGLEAKGLAGDVPGMLSAGVRRPLDVPGVLLGVPGVPSVKTRKSIKNLFILTQYFSSVMLFVHNLLNGSEQGNWSGMDNGWSTNKRKVWQTKDRITIFLEKPRPKWLKKPGYGMVEQADFCNLTSLCLYQFKYSGNEEYRKKENGGSHHHLLISIAMMEMHCTFCIDKSNYIHIP